MIKLNKLGEANLVGGENMLSVSWSGKVGETPPRQMEDLSDDKIWSSLFPKRGLEFRIMTYALNCEKESLHSYSDGDAINNFISGNVMDVITTINNLNVDDQCKFMTHLWFLTKTIGSIITGSIEKKKTFVELNRYCDMLEIKLTVSQHHKLDYLRDVTAKLYDAYAANKKVVKDIEDGVVISTVLEYLNYMYDELEHVIKNAYYIDVLIAFMTDVVKTNKNGKLQ